MYHCYFLINYIGPPKVFFLSFGPLFKKFAHHWFIALLTEVLCSVNMFLICKFSSSVLANLTSGVCRLIIFFGVGGSLELMRLTNGRMVLVKLGKKMG